VNEETILELLPEIMRKLMGGHPPPAGLRALTLGQVRALHFVTDHSGCTMGELAEGLGVSLAASTGLVDRLIQQGLVARAADPTDRRRVRLQLTDGGRHAHVAAKRRARRRMAAALATLSAAEQRQITSALVRLRQALSK